MFLLEPTGSEMLVSERIVFTNSGQVTFNDPSGSLKFYVPEGVSGAINVRIQARKACRSPGPPRKATSRMFTCEVPDETGETNVDVSYTMRMSGNESEIRG
jgi:hypothetical protein